MNSTDRQQLTKEITMEFIRKIIPGQKIDTGEINRLVDNIIGVDEEEDDSENTENELNSTGPYDKYTQIPFLYMGHYGSANYSDFLSGYYGSLLHIDSLVTYSGRDIDELWVNFKKCVEFYIQTSKMKGINSNG